MEDELLKGSQEARFYSRGQKGLVCELCPHGCHIAEGKNGICQTRINKVGKLYAINYGKPCSVNIDPIEKKPLYHFLPGSKAFSIGTAGCNFNCRNCQNSDISQVSPLDINHYSLMPSAVVALALENKCQSIAYTYNEPTVFYEYMFDTAKLAHEAGIKNVMISNGYINEKPLRTLYPHLDAANIDLKCFSEETYHSLSGGHLEPVLNTLKMLKEEGIWIEITNLIIPDWTDDFDKIKKMCDWLYDAGLSENPLHFSRFFPTYKLSHAKATPMEVLYKAHEIAINCGIKYVYLGNVSDKEFEATVCPECKTKLLERERYTIVRNQISNGKCANCGAKISGVWEN